MRTMLSAHDGSRVMCAIPLFNLVSAQIAAGAAGNELRMVMCVSTSPTGTAVVTDAAARLCHAVTLSACIHACVNRIRDASPLQEHGFRFTVVSTVEGS